MRRLSHADLRLLYLRRRFLAEFIQLAGVQAQTNLEDSWRRLLARAKAVRDEIKAVVDDPNCDLLVSEPRQSHPQKHTYSARRPLVYASAMAATLSFATRSRTSSSTGVAFSHSCSKTYRAAA